MAKDGHWMEHAEKKMEAKGTKGSFTKAAHKAGKSVPAFARKEKHAGGAMGKKDNFALNAAKARHK